MASLKLIQAARANGALSRGPVTPEGKSRSSQNAIRHGLLARTVVMKDESRPAFDALLQQQIDFFQPANAMELGFVEEMAVAQWRMRRVWALETRLFENAVDAQPPGDPIDRMANAFTSLANSPALALLHRYETRLHCANQRSLQNALVVRAATGNANLPIGAIDISPQETPAT